MASYYDEKRKKYVVENHGVVKEYPEKPGFMDYLKEGFEPAGNKAELEAIRRKRQSRNE